MNKNRDREVALKAIQIKGAIKQLAKCSEELSELSKVCSRAIVDDRVDTKQMAEEIADVKFTILQLMLIMGGNEEINTFQKLVDLNYEYKVERTNELLDMDIKEMQARARMMEQQKQEESDVSNSGNTE